MWVLIVILTASAAPNISTANRTLSMQQFEGKQACENVADLVQVSMGKNLIAAVCMPSQ